MPSKALAEVIERAERLTPDEQLQLIAHLAQAARRTTSGTRTGRSWMELQGAAPYPLVGEDAQTWVSRTRREGDEARERALKRQP